MECDCLRFQENFNLIEYRATDLEHNTRAEELQKKAFLTPDWLIPVINSEYIIMRYFLLNSEGG